jgi:hypothetical protein
VYVLISLPLPTLRVFNWTGANDCGALVTEDALAFGGRATAAGEFGLYLDFDLKAGTTGPCATFGNTTPLINTTRNPSTTTDVDDDNDGGEDDDDCMEFRCSAVEFFKFTTDKQ